MYGCVFNHTHIFRYLEVMKDSLLRIVRIFQRITHNRGGTDVHVTFIANQGLSYRLQIVNVLLLRQLHMFFPQKS